MTASYSDAISPINEIEFHKFNEKFLEKLASLGGAESTRLRDFHAEVKRLGNDYRGITKAIFRLIFIPQKSDNPEKGEEPSYSRRALEAADFLYQLPDGKINPSLLIGLKACGFVEGRFGEGEHSSQTRPAVVLSIGAGVDPTPVVNRAFESNVPQAIAPESKGTIEKQLEEFTKIFIAKALERGHKKSDRMGTFLTEINNGTLTDDTEKFTRVLEMLCEKQSERTTFFSPARVSGPAYDILNAIDPTGNYKELLRNFIIQYGPEGDEARDHYFCSNPQDKGFVAKQLRSLEPHPMTHTAAVFAPDALGSTRPTAPAHSDLDFAAPSRPGEDFGL
jgi:hypothetical protein